MNEHRLSKIVSRVAIMSGLWLASCALLESDDDDDDTTQRSPAATGLGGDGGSDASADTRDAGGKDAQASTDVDLCSVELPARNDSRDTPSLLSVDLPVHACLGTEQDVDFYELKSPATDGYYLLAVTDVERGGLAQIDVYNMADNSLVGNVYGENRTGPTFFYFAAAPGQHYRFRVYQFSSFQGPWHYTLQASYTSVADSYEPNDTRDDAKPIAVNTPISAYLFSGFKVGDVSKAQLDDWYALELAAGPASIAITSTPRDLTTEVGMLDASGKIVELEGSSWNATRGSDFMVKSKPLTAGSYRLRVGVFSVLPESAGGSDVTRVVPDSFTRPYKLTVTQP